MNIKNHTYYFGKVPAEYRDIHKPIPENWEHNYYFRFKIPHEYDDQINFEDSCGRCVPFSFKDLCAMRDTLEHLIYDISQATIGADYE